MKPRLSDLGRRTGRRRCPAIVSVVFLAVAAVPLAWPIATRAENASVPDSARIAWVRFELRHFEDVRVVTGSEKILSHRPVVSSDGLRLGSPPTGWELTSWTPPPRRLVSWAEIESIHARRGASGSSVLLGALAGLGVGMVIVMGDALDHAYAFDSSTSVWGTPILLGVVGGAALGALIGRPGPWESVYP